MNEQTLQHLKYLLINPYTWLFFVFIFSLPYIFQYMRRFFPKKLQEQMAKEEACTLELNQKPEMRRMRKYIFIGIVISFILTLILSYSLDKPFSIVLSITMIPVMLYAMITEHKINKGERCLQFYSKDNLLKLIGIYGGLVVLLIFIIVYFEIGRVR